MIPKHTTCLLKKPDTVLVPYAAIIPKPTMLPFVSTELWAGVDIRSSSDQETVTLGPPF